MPRFRFDFAISYAGEDESVAENLAVSLGNFGASVYFAPRFRSTLLGRRMSTEFGSVFGPLTRFFVPVISRHYARKDYPQYEWQIALGEGKEREREFIIPVRLDDTPLVGLPLDTGHIDLRATTMDAAARQLRSEERRVGKECRL